MSNHSGRIDQVGVDDRTGKALWQGRCSFTWQADRTNTNHNNSG